MSLIRDNDDERRARVEALICELLRPPDHVARPSDLHRRDDAADRIERRAPGREHSIRQAS